jgi:hypothetical protein
MVLALVGLGTAGCAFITPQATTKIVEASDGVNGTLGDVAVRNATLISEDGELASLLVSFVNRSDSPIDLTIQYENGESGERVDQSVTLVADGAISSFGAEGGEQIQLESVSAPGSLFPVYFQYGDVEGVQLMVPVLTTSLPEYSGLAPTPIPTVVVTPEPVVVTPAAEPTPEPTPAVDAPAE